MDDHFESIQPIGYPDNGEISGLLKISLFFTKEFHGCPGILPLSGQRNFK
jgi:hypothetical protein